MSKIKLSNPKDAVWLGVCGGLASRYDFDPFFVRLLFCLCMVFTFYAPLLYLILYACMEKADEEF